MTWEADGKGGVDVKPLDHELVAADELSGDEKPFALAFSEVWHYTFGAASKSLAESGFYVTPRRKGNRYEGYVPLVWESSLLALPGGRR